MRTCLCACVYVRYKRPQHLTHRDKIWHRRALKRGSGIHAAKTMCFCPGLDVAAGFAEGWDLKCGYEFVAGVEIATGKAWHQLWARYLEWDKIPTKIGSGQVRSRSRSGRPPRLFDKSGSGSGRATRLFEISRQFGESPDWPLFISIASIYPDFPRFILTFVSKIRVNWTKKTFSSRLRDGKSRPSPTYLAHTCWASLLELSKVGAHFTVSLYSTTFRISIFSWISFLSLKILVIKSC